MGCCPKIGRRRKKKNRRENPRTGEVQLEKEEERLERKKIRRAKSSGRRGWGVGPMRGIVGGSWIETDMILD